MFGPMEDCFEVFGLDFLVDDSCHVSLLEVNPGPDFKQTGQRLKHVIAELWEQTCVLVIDDYYVREGMSGGGGGSAATAGVAGNGSGELDSSRVLGASENERLLFPRVTKDFVRVYRKKWSVAGLKMGMSLF